MRRHAHSSRIASIAACLLVLSAATNVAAVPTADAVEAPASAVAMAEDEGARAMAHSLSDSAWRAKVQKAALAFDEVPITTLASETRSAVLPTLVEADRKILAAKGLDPRVGQLLRLRLGDDSMRAALAAGVTPWVAAAAFDDDARFVTAYDISGQMHTLDVRVIPSHPVYVVDIDSAQAVAAGLGVIHEELLRQGLNSSASAVPTGLWTTRITAVRVSNDEEPWIKGKAEIYTLVTGFGKDGRVRVDLVGMPYLDEGKTTYHPNQIMVNWSNYRYNLADAVMMEDDGNTNYRDLAKAVATALLAIADQGMYVPLVNAVLDAVPDSWWTDEDDYVDSWYALAKSANGKRYGARGNGWMTVQPYFVEQF
ncbi:DUF3103 domain-containing protein [Streptomyces sp. NBC_01077]|uniref:DUF3103 family protein n=1 Tax=Streptomyces sp. NBC_01077 TaxID=2903746 RepID=UPI0038682CCB|nr:DUF3103 domain-containing protein [Streptomyces sp. NBC_01077]WSV43736.1 DUF3103 domain-containing protein [Streptomyces sp. NBC_01077]